MRNDWQYVKIGEICTVERGGSPRPIDKYITDSADGINWIKIGDTSDSMYITSTEQKIIPEGMKKSRYVQPGDFLLSNSMSFGRPYILKIDGCIHDGWLVLRDNKDVFDKRFLYYYLSAPSTYEKFKSMAVGGVVNNLNSEMVRGVSVPVPTKDEQIEIVNVLEKLTALISLRKQQLAKLDELVKARFVELFGDDVPTTKLGDVCRMINGDRGKNYPSGDDFVEEGVPFVNAGHLQNRKVDFYDMNYITEDKFNLLSQGKMQEGDILYCLRGSLGKHGLVDFERGAVASSLVILRCNQEKVLPKFLLYALETPEIELQLTSANNGSSQPNLSSASVKAYDIKLPAIEQQKQFVTFVEQTDKSKSAIQQSLEKLETLKKALMQKYFG